MKVYKPDKFKRGCLIAINGKVILICPHCGNQGTSDYCKDFTQIKLGYYLCRRCGKEFTIFGTNVKENIKIAMEFLNPEQKRATDSISKNRRERIG